MTYLWNFGDGQTSTDQNPTHTYIQQGFYTVSLTVTNAYGSNTAVKNNYIAIGVSPAANFVATPISGTAPQNVQFTDLSGGGATDWLWDFGDGQTSTAQNPTHTYYAGGTYTVILTVSNGFGSSVSYQEPVYCCRRTTPVQICFKPNPGSDSAHGHVYG